MSEGEKGRRRTLGRGLSALLGEEDEDMAELDRVRQLRTVGIDELGPSPFQPRRHFDQEDIDELAASIAAKGILQPILVRRSDSGAINFEIVAGERRWRAAQKAGLHEVPVLVRDLDDRDAAEVALVENVQRRDLSPIEEAEGYRRLIDEFGHTQEVLAEIIGRSRSHVANMMRLLSLPDPVRSHLDSGALSAGHARALLTAEDPEAVAEHVIAKQLNVRQTEALCRSVKGQGEKPRGQATTGPTRQGLEKDPDTLAVERELSDQLGLAVTISPDRDFQSGTIAIAYATLEQLDGLLALLGKGLPARAGEQDVPDQHYSDLDLEDDQNAGLDPARFGKEPATDSHSEKPTEDDLADALDTLPAGDQGAEEELDDDSGDLEAAQEDIEALNITDFDDEEDALVNASRSPSGTLPD